jgi:LmbE family N-acetylglucosaminyl deacetylase
MATFLFFHAHPDDEAIATGGSMASLAADGHRVILLVATKGEHGEVADGFLDPGESLGDRRVRETHAAGAVLGVAAVEFLGYVDSGMMGEPENDQPGSFWSADVEEAAARVADLLRREAVDVLIVYDENGNYGHPDHIQVHRVGVRAAELAGTPEVFESTVNRDEMLRNFRHFAEQGLGPNEPPPVDEFELGLPEERMTTVVDVRAWLEQKRDAMRVHASQIGENSFFLSMPDDVFETVWGREWYIHRGIPTPVSEYETSLLPVP